MIAPALSRRRTSGAGSVCGGRPEQPAQAARPAAERAQGRSAGLRLLADGRTNRQIAEELFISVETVGACGQHAGQAWREQPRARLPRWPTDMGCSDGVSSELDRLHAERRGHALHRRARGPARMTPMSPLKVVRTFRRTRMPGSP
ncbi:LuxR C-terminal-related transcriptional regulator [Microtetraspora niveoalba]|uniref:LuxR C-terminal-related transcriptional regulator n=1 Tax=Microtetraspora niveoalba TaxID=46175 RepID=UPI001C3F321A